MRKMVMLGICLAMVIGGCAGQPPPKKQLKAQLYTAYNIWKYPGTLYCINFKKGNEFIPAGTAVKKVSIMKDQGFRYIRFRIADTNQLVILQFYGRWHPGQTARSYKKSMFTKKNFTKLTQRLSAEEIQSIKNGLVTVGMSKRAVLVSYGLPPEHYTKDLSSKEWYYWMNRVQKKKICFDENDRAQHCRQTTSDKI